ncbi:MAG: hypothetical protein DDT31_01624 [Syntrophomonadaceae bacterium]|nr:hypothetical protein [Bacillota bacterium]
MPKIEKSKKSEKTFVDWNELDKSLVQDVDPEADAFERNPPPQPGYYKAKLGWQDNEEGVIQTVEDDDGKLVGYRLYMTAMILQGQYKGTVLPVWLGTRQSKGKQTSQVASLLVKMGVPIKKRMSHRALVLALRDLVNKGCMCYVRIGWRGSVQIDGEWKNVINNEMGFDKKDGVYVSTVSKKVNGEYYTIEAQANVDKFYAENPDIEQDDEDEEEEIEKGGKVKDGKSRTGLDEDESEEDENEDENDEDEDEDEVVKEEKEEEKKSKKTKTTVAQPVVARVSKKKGKDDDWDDVD